MTIGNRENNGRSPYVKYGKKPRMYSELYRRWKAAISAGHDDEAKRLSAQHQKQFLLNLSLSYQPRAAA